MVKRGDPVAEKGPGQIGKAKEPHVDQNAPDDGKDHHGQLGRLHQRVAQRLQPHAAIKRHEEDNEGAHGTALGRCAPGIAEGVVDKEDDDHHDRHDGQRRRQGQKALAST